MMFEFESLRRFWKNERKPEAQREYARYDATNLQRKIM
ncbi:hypothetical protein TSIB_1656 [Thermococcus sibiricus MM 739]|uniref:Uncharacterized protein n=1 Tax=Thermococcus sibiricus (strain DSM 12597 / MM 739) TaxID=604354 RepID=C6A512_THESM|nr:hypothetical protein TSIB_1656 [Thermococcus sibiricus MM 739]